MLRDVTNRNELATILNIPKKKLTFILYKKGTDNLYNSFEIPKKSGGIRIISAPTIGLKSVQRSLTRILSIHQESMLKENGICSRISHAFEKKKSIITNAEAHRNKRVLLNVDLENFFDCFHFGRVVGFFMKNRYLQLSKEVATVIAQLACYHGRLPQGAPSSPVITNLISQILDIRVLKLAKKYKLDYTRYADDLSFSTNDIAFINRSNLFLEELACVINNAGFKINEKKTRFQFCDSRQTVTGLIVNKRINTPIEYHRATRAMAHNLYKNGSFIINNSPGSIEQLEGRFSFINHIDSLYKKTSVGKKDGDKKLTGREKQYQKFLFYKYFFFNSTPIIITEGKTDQIYIKSALKKLYYKYPDLIEKLENEDFKMRINFLKKTPN